MKKQLKRIACAINLFKMKDINLFMLVMGIILIILGLFGVCISISFFKGIILFDMVITFGIQLILGSVFAIGGGLEWF